MVCLADCNIPLWHFIRKLLATLCDAPVFALLPVGIASSWHHLAPLKRHLCDCSAVAAKASILAVKPISEQALPTASTRK
jgi:hypothetical protein